MSKKERKQTNLNRIGLFETAPLVAATQVDEPELIVSHQVTKEEVPPKRVPETKPFLEDKILQQVTQISESPRPMIRVGFEIYRDLDKKIELLVVEEGKKKRDIINELLELGLTKR